MGLQSGPASVLFVQFLLEVARQKNQTPLPLIKPYTGPRLPPDRYCLTAPNYRLKSIQKKVNQCQLLLSNCACPVSPHHTCLSPQVTSSAGRISVPRLSVGAVSSRPSTPTLGEPCDPGPVFACIVQPVCVYSDVCFRHRSSVGPVSQHQGQCPGVPDGPEVHRADPSILSDHH